MLRASENQVATAHERTQQQQVVSVTGVVVEASGEPVIGASVVEKGTTNGSITDVDGRFALSVKPRTTLVISYVGFTAHGVRLRALSHLGSQTLEKAPLYG